MMTPFDGTMSLTLKGTREKPITIKSAGDGEVIFDGAGNHRLFDVMASQYHIFDGLTFRNTDVAIFRRPERGDGRRGPDGEELPLRDIGFGVWTEYAGSSDFYIADNLFLGRDDRLRLVGWTGPMWASAGPYGSHQLTSYYAIKVYGPGHVIAHNAIAYFHDALGISTYGTPEPDPERQPSSIDIYNNDMHMSNDDFMETDGGVHNIRVFNNRGVNAAMGGYSSQPVFGGPVYFYPQHPLSCADRRGVQVLGQARRHVRVSQHHHRRADRDAIRIRTRTFATTCFSAAILPAAAS